MGSFLMEYKIGIILWKSSHPLELKSYSYQICCHSTYCYIGSHNIWGGKWLSKCRGSYLSSELSLCFI